MAISRLRAAVVAAALGTARLAGGPAAAQEADRAGPSPGSAFRKAPDFVLFDLENHLVRLSDFKGKIVLLNFWATWCPPCQAEIPALVRVYHRFKQKGVVVLGVSLDDRPAQAVPGFLADFERDKGVAIDFPILAGDKRITSLYGGIRGIPTTFVIDRAGLIRNRHVGPPGVTDREIEAGFRADVEPLL